MKTAAFFDFDDTVIKGNSGIRNVVNYFLTFRVNPLRGFSIFYRYLFYYLGRAEPKDFFLNIYAFLRGRPYAQESARCRKFFEKKLQPRIYKDALRLIAWHKKRGHVVAVVSNSLNMMIGMVKTQLGVDYILGSTLEVKEGIITGRTELINFGRNKVKTIRDFAKKLNIDLKKSYAYSDNNTDIEMLKTVGFPVAVNPKRKMRKFALAKDWRILAIR